MKRSFVTLLVLAVVVLVPGYSIAVPISPLFNTGTIANGTLLVEGSSDPHYELITSPDGLFPGPQSYVVLSTGHPIPNSWLANGPNSEWIAPQSNQDENAGGGNEGGIYVYRTTFDLTGYNQTTAHIAGQWSADNLGLDILINGTSTGYTVPDFGWTSLHDFAIDSGFVSGMNTLDFVLQNYGGPTGLRVELAGTASVPEPATIVLGVLVLPFLAFRRGLCRRCKSLRVPILVSRTSTIRERQIAIGRCLQIAISLLVLGTYRSASYADQRYATDFQAFQIGSVNGQDNWVVSQIPGGTFDWGVITDDGTGNKVLEVRSGFSSLNEGRFGGEVRRPYDTQSTERYLQVEMDFQLRESRFFFNDHVGPSGAPDALYWASGGVYPANTNAFASVGLNSWHHVGMVIDQDLRGVIAFIFDGTRVSTIDSSVHEANRFDRFVFRGAGGSRAAGRLWIDNISVRDFVPEPSTTLMAVLSGLFILMNPLGRRRAA